MNCDKETEMKLQKKDILEKMTSISTVRTTDGDDAVVKHLVEKILSLKQSFQKQGLFYKILNNKDMSKAERRASMMILGMGSKRGSQVSNFANLNANGKGNTLNTFQGGFSNYLKGVNKKKEGDMRSSIFSNSGRGDSPKNVSFN
jgi:hypothetical protein